MEVKVVHSVLETGGLQATVPFPVRGGGGA